MKTNKKRTQGEKHIYFPNVIYGCDLQLVKKKMYHVATEGRNCIMSYYAMTSSKPVSSADITEKKLCRKKIIIISIYIMQFHIYHQMLVTILESTIWITMHSDQASFFGNDTGSSYANILTVYCFQRFV